MIEAVQNYTNRLLQDVEEFTVRYQAFTKRDPSMKEEEVLKELAWLLLRSGEVVASASFLGMKLDALFAASGQYQMRASKDRLQEKLQELTRDYRTVSLALGESSKLMRRGENERYGKEFRNPLNDSFGG